MDLTQRKSQANAPKLSAERVGEYTGYVKGWQVANDRLKKTLTFPDFVTAMEFLNRVAELAESENHHPDFAVHYNRVEFEIFTHSAGGITENDFVLAAKIDALA